MERLGTVDVLDVDGREPSWHDVLFAGIALFAEAAVCDTGAVIVRARGWAREGNCPSCGRPSSRVHDRYRRQLQDVPLAARPVRIVLEVRRFVCVNTECGQRTFAEQIRGFTSPFARCTTGWGHAERDRTGTGRPCRSAHGHGAGHHGGAGRGC
ncbi:transposase family protein [Streptomyces sp. NL15-2K]|uniref:transposase family protein n=1 Tax=Streptomyces sp. NL15-2K TaxID=376149 RepID=UPI000F57C990|nr:MULTISPECIES: transposase family protein [Actinomycetes]WKX06122.1 transposase family protein [Kutzneria buriramensis]GCB42807.1 mobile element protein [Streptomyces sp. NL15-2K]